MGRGASSFIFLLLSSSKPVPNTAGSGPEAPKATMSTDTQRRVLFLVTTPVSESLDWVLYKIDSATRESPLPTQEVD